MTTNSKSLVKLCCILVSFFPKNPLRKCRPFLGTSARCSTLCRTELQTSSDVLKRWGCTDDDVSRIFARLPSLANADVSQLQSKLTLLQSLGIASNADLVNLVLCRPRLLKCRVNSSFEERLQGSVMLFGSRELLLKAVLRNPSLLTYDFYDKIKHCIALYEGLDVAKNDLILMILSRPTLISRTSFDDEKLEFIRKTGIPKDSKMYKYVVTLIGVSRVETIREKVTNLAKFGISEEEFWSLVGRAPFLLTMSVEKVQRNMTFVVGTMKLPANVVLKKPFLLFKNLEAVLRPRVFLAGKMHDMGLSPEMKGDSMLTAIKMTEDRFLKAFVLCHPEDVAKELMEIYRNAKRVKRLAAASKTVVNKGFPF